MWNFDSMKSFNWLLEISHHTHTHTKPKSHTKKQASYKWQVQPKLNRRKSHVTVIGNTYWHVNMNRNITFETSCLLHKLGSQEQQLCKLRFMNGRAHKTKRESECPLHVLYIYVYRRCHSRTFLAESSKWRFDLKLIMIIQKYTKNPNNVTLNVLYNSYRNQ